jgi:urease subunit beta/urease subunit gamma/beta
VIPGEWLIGDEPIEVNAGRRTARILVRNTGDRPIQVGSHFHFFEVNMALEFDRRAAFGMRLDVPSGQSVRFESGDEREVELVEFGGTKRVIGFGNRVNGSTSIDHAATSPPDVGSRGVPTRRARPSTRERRTAPPMQAQADNDASSGLRTRRRGPR